MQRWIDKWAVEKRKLKEAKDNPEKEGGKVDHRRILGESERNESLAVKPRAREYW